MNSKIEQNENTIVILKQEISTEQSKLSEKIQELSSLSEAQVLLKEKFTETVKERDCLIQNNFEKENTINNQSQQIDSLNSEISKWSSNFETKQFELNDANTKIEKLNIVSLDFESKWNEEIKSHKQTQIDFENNKQSLESEIEKLTSESNSLKENISQCKKKEKKLRKRNNSNFNLCLFLFFLVESKLTKAQDEISMLQNSLSEAKQNLEESSIRFSQLENEMKHWKSQAESFEQKFSDLLNEKSQVDSELSETKRALSFETKEKEKFIEERNQEEESKKFVQQEV